MWQTMTSCSYYINLTEGADPLITEDDVIFYIYYYVLLFLITIINLVGNSMIILAFLRYRKLR